ncbi:MT-A70-domain-containing protein [Delphinella strobiligena]|nr:MT-A70-domain-containing protein [Delphinella strobiligena]
MVHSLRVPQCRHSHSCILYQDDDITLLDIPRSIAAAQGTAQSPCHSNIRSCEPLTSPYPSNEPRSDAAKARLKAKMATKHDALYAACISNALLAAHKSYQGEWCLPRCVLPRSTAVGKKRKLNEFHPTQETMSPEQDMVLRSKPERSAPDSDVQLSHLLKHLASHDPVQGKEYKLHCIVTSNDDPHNIIAPSTDLQDTNTLMRCHHRLVNSTVHPRKLKVSAIDLGPTSFLIPPCAAFYLGDCASSRPFHSAVQKQTQAESTSYHFNFVILDPPWPNSSVARARNHKKSGYDTAPSIWDMRQLLFEMDIDVLLADHGLVAIWITNNPAVRELVLGEDGLFDSWGVTLEQEWLWIKTTLSGEPVTPLDSFWRKPYEVLLLGRKTSLQSANVGEDQDVKRRVIAAVPDLHSRKPCLKELIEPLMLNPSYRALEVFARYLVAGWWSWGNEVLKFNHEKYWTDVDAD